MPRPRARLVAAGAAVLVSVAALVVMLASSHGAPKALTAVPELAPDHRACATPTALTQSPSGRIDGCVQVGALRSGHYRAGLQELLPFNGPAQGSGTAGQSLRVSLSPGAGPPGTVVTLHVTLRRPIAAARRPRLSRAGPLVLGLAEWDGPRGLMLTARHFRWTSDRTFEAQITVPAAPWIELGAHPLVLGLHSGEFPVTVTCTRGGGGCAEAPDGEAGFHLQVDRRTPWCASPDRCATLAVYPRRVPAGAMVRVSGYAPLAGFDDGPSESLGSAHIIWAHRSKAAAPRLVQRSAPPTGDIEHAGRAPLTVVAGPTFASLGTVRTQWIVASGQSEITPDPGDRRIVAWCGTGGIDVSLDGHIEHVSTVGVPAVLRRLHGLPAVRGAPRPMSCADVMPLSASMVLAAFSGALPRFGDEQPPVYFYALETRNRGRSWTPLPVPRGSQSAYFAGFRPAGRGGEAIYALAVRPATALAQGARPLAERTAADGASWRPARLDCPSAGPCVTLGPFLPGNCAQGLSTQFVLRAGTAERGWRRSPILDANAFACGDVQLASIGGGDELLVNALSPYPLQLSRNAGVSWTALRMPLPARVNTPNALDDFGPGGITLLPGGALLLSGGGSYSGGWQLLRPGARHWCEVAGQHGTWQFAPQASRLTPIGSELWWLTWGSTPSHGATPVHVHKLPISAVRCG